MLQATARVEDKGQGDKYRRKELLKECMSMLRETGSHDVLVERCCAILQNDVRTSSATEQNYYLLPCADGGSGSHSPSHDLILGCSCRTD